jgi:uncharacterized protein (DUF1697 family)
MALVAFLRGINVGGHRSFRPSALARELADFDVVNIGAAGTFVVRKPGSAAKFRAALLRQVPFVAEVMLCDGRAVQRLVAENPFASEVLRPDLVRFVSILTGAVTASDALPITIPTDGDWYVRVLGSRECFVFGVYRRQMKTIGYLGQLDKLLGAPVTTRGWSTMMKVAEILSGDDQVRR